MKKGQKGFGLLEALLILVLGGIVGFVGWYVWDSKNKTDSNSDVTSQTANSTVTSPSKSIDAYRYKLPENWSEITCGEKNNQSNPEYKLASPDKDKATSCADRTNTVFFMVPSSADDSYGKCLTTKELNQYKKLKPIVSYECHKVTINGVEAIVETADFGGGPMIDYSLSGKVNFSITYYANAGGALPYSSVVKEIAYSVKFN